MGYTMNYRQCLLFALAGAVLLVPVTSHYAISVEEVKASVSKFFNFDEDTLKKVIPTIVALTVIGGLYYWWKSRRGGDGGEKLKTQKPLIGPEKLSLQQFEVYSQFGTGGGGAASCGYHTLLRGMQVIKGKYEHESDEALQEILVNFAPILAYISEGSDWRNDIIARRKDQELKKVLHKNLITALTLQGDEKAIDLYKSALGFLEDIIIVNAKDPNYRIQPYDFTNEAIESYVKNSLNKLKNKDNEILVEKLQESNEIARYFDFDKMRKTCLSNDFILKLPVIIDTLNKRYDLQEDFRGEWLSDGELEYLWAEHRFDIIPTEITVNCGFKAIANFELVDNPDVSKEFDEVAIYIDENVKPVLNKKQQMFQLFGLGTMRQTGEKTGTRGHWYPLVMYQDQEGKRQYYITDSASADNRNRTQDTNAWKIINLIEKAASF